MKNKLLITTALVAAVFSANDSLAGVVFTNDSEVTSQSGYDSADNRISFNKDADGNNPVLTLAEDVELGSYVTLHDKTVLNGDNKTLTVKGYLTETAPGSDLSGVNLKIEKGTVGQKTEGELVIGNDLTVGNVEMAEGTGIFLHNTDEDYVTDGKTLTIANGKILSLNNGYIKGTVNEEKSELTLAGKGTVKNGGVTIIEQNVVLDSNLDNTGRIALAEDVTLTANKQLKFDGTFAPGKYVGISSTNVTEVDGLGDGTEGTLILNDGIELTNGAGVWVNDIEINGGDVVLDGIMADPNPSEAVWRAGSMLGANNAITVKDAKVTVSNNGQFNAGAGGLSFANTEIDMSGAAGKEALLRVWEGDKGLTIDKDSTININGEAVISADKASVAGTINLDGTLAVRDRSNETDAKGNLTLEDGAKVVSNVKSEDDFGKITGNINVAENGTVTLDTHLANGMTEFSGKVFADGIKLNDGAVIEAGNALWNGNVDEEGVVNYTKKNSSEVAAATGASATQAEALLAVTGSADTGHAGFDQAAAIINDMAQSVGGVKTALDEIEVMGADTAPVVRATQTNITNQTFNAVSSQLSGGAVASASEGAASGDVWNGVKTWVRTLFNHSKLDGTSKTKGFDSDTYGIAFGVDKQIDAKTKVGIGYAYSQTDIDSHRRDIDVDTHTAILYGEYKPSNWYVNGIATYNWSEYDESKSVANVNADAKYDVDTIGLQAMAGYEFDVNGYMLTPEAGLRYVRIDQDGYTDKLGTRIGSDTSDIATAVAGVKASKDFALDNGMNIRPEARLAMSYDLTDDDNNVAVTLAGGQGYVVDGEDFGRFGIETGLGVVADVNDNWELSAGYEGHYRDDYTDHSGVLSAKYKF